MRGLQIVTVVAFSLACGGCTTLATLRAEQAQDNRARYEAIIRDAKAFADKRTVVARGSRTCLVTQYQSAFKTEAEARRRASSSFESERGTVPIIGSRSNVAFSVDRSGAVRMQASRSTFPHSDMFFMVDGQRLRGRENVGVPITGNALQALIDEKPFDYSYFLWPAGESSGRDVFRGFRAAMEECRAHVSARL